MTYPKILSTNQSLFLEYLLEYNKKGQIQLPSIKNISKELGLSIPLVREQIELAKTLGLIEIKPRKGISLLPYKFSPAVTKSVYFAVLSKKHRFQQFSDLRNQLEKAYFLHAASTLNETDIKSLKLIVEIAKDKIHLPHAQIPHVEHRKFHLEIYKHIDNVFLTGILESYWDLYELVGMDLYNDLEYLDAVWDYHQKITELIEANDYTKAFILLDEHMNFINKRSD